MESICAAAIAAASSALAARISNGTLTCSAPFRSSSEHRALTGSAPSRSASRRSAPLKIVPCNRAAMRSASTRLAPVKSAPRRSAFMRLVAWSDARRRLTPQKSTPVRIIPSSAAPSSEMARSGFSERQRFHGPEPHFNRIMTSGGTESCYVGNQGAERLRPYPPHSLRKRVLRFEIRIAGTFVEAMSLDARHIRRESDERATTLGRQLLGTCQQAVSNTLLAVLAVNHQAADRDEGVSLGLLSEHHVKPSDGPTPVVGDEQLLFAAGQQTREAAGHGCWLGRVAKLFRHLRNRLRVRRLCGSDRDVGVAARRSAHRFERTICTARSIR